MSKAWRLVLVVFGVFILALGVITYFQIQHFKTEMILAQIENGKLAVSQKKAVDVLNAKHEAEILRQEAETLKQKNINVTAQGVIASIKVATKAEIVALRQSSASWEVKFDTLELGYDLLLDKSGKQNGLIEGLKMEIDGLQNEISTLKSQKVESDTLYEGQIASWKKQLAVCVRKSGRSFGVTAGMTATFGTDGKIHYGAGATIGWRLY